MRIDWRHLFFSLEGRIPRSQFWIGIGAILLFQGIVQIPAMSFGGVNPELGDTPLWFRNLSLFLDAICAWPLFAVLCKRQQDRNQQPWLSFYFVALLVTFSILEAFGLTQDGPRFTVIGWIAGLPLLFLAIIVIADLGVRPGEKGPNAYGPDPLR